MMMCLGKFFLFMNKIDAEQNFLAKKIDFVF